MPSVVKKIEVMEEQVSSAEKRLDTIERRLRLSELTIKERSTLEDEEQEVKRNLEKLYSDLRSLRFENIKTMIVSVIILVILYGLFYFFTSSQENTLNEAT